MAAVRSHATTGHSTLTYSYTVQDDGHRTITINKVMHQSIHMQRRVRTDALMCTRGLASYICYGALVDGRASVLYGVIAYPQTREWSTKQLADLRRMMTSLVLHLVYSRDEVALCRDVPRAE